MRCNDFYIQPHSNELAGPVAVSHLRDLPQKRLHRLDPHHQRRSGGGAWDASGDLAQLRHCGATDRQAERQPEYAECSVRWRRRDTGAQHGSHLTTGWNCRLHDQVRRPERQRHCFTWLLQRRAVQAAEPADGGHTQGHVSAVDLGAGRHQPGPSPAFGLITQRFAQP